MGAQAIWTSSTKSRTNCLAVAMALPMRSMKKVAMKVAMKKAMKKAMKSQIAKGKRAKSSVFRGTKSKSSGGLTKDKLIKNKRGKVVSKAASAAARKRSSHFV